MRPTTPALAALVLSAAPALASTDDAWVQFRAEVDAACRAIVQEPGDIAVEVNPFGSQSYGATIVTVTSGGADTQRMICIYDKVAKSAELTVPF